VSSEMIYGGRRQAFHFSPYKIHNSFLFNFAMASTNDFDHSPGAISSHADIQRSSSFVPSVSSSKKGRLQDDFQPSEYSVLCGRGKDSFNHVGNSRFRILVGMFVERYSKATTRTAKSAIVSEIVKMIRQAGGNFCQFKRGAWFEVGDIYAREKVSAKFRDLLHTQYSSSNKCKVARRRVRKQNLKQKAESRQKLIDGTGHSDDSSKTSSGCGSSTDSLMFDQPLQDDLFDVDVFFQA
jgi:hypothetical protein